MSAGDVFYLSHASEWLTALRGVNQRTRVPLSEGRKLEAALKHAGGTPEMHVYPGEGHIVSLDNYADVVRRGTQFFRSQLHAS